MSPLNMSPLNMSSLNMSPPDVSPAAARLRRPRWADPRVGLGLALVVGSVVAGARVVAAADDTRAVWALTRNLPVGSTLTATDLTVRQVRLDGAVNPYVSAASPAPVGRVLARGVGADELLPAAAVSAEGAAPERLVTVPVGRDRLPLGLANGQRVDVYVTVTDDAGDQKRRQVLAVTGARVEQVEDAGRYSGGDGRVVLAVPVPRVAALVAALASGSVDLVRLP